MDVVLFYSFDGFLKLKKNTLGYEAGEKSKVSSKAGGSKDVIAYATFDLTEEEFTAAKIEMHAICKTQGHSYKVANLLCERIQDHMDELLANKKALEAEKELLEHILENKMYNLYQNLKSCI